MNRLVIIYDNVHIHCLYLYLEHKLYKKLSHHSNSLIVFIMTSNQQKGYRHYKRGVPSMGIFPRESDSYLRNEIQASKKIAEDGKRLSRRARLGSNLTPPVYQFLEQSLSTTCGATIIIYIYHEDKNYFH